MTESKYRKTPLGRKRKAPRIEPTYGKAALRRARKKAEAEARNKLTKPENRRAFRRKESDNAAEQPNT
jgi:hypothetical protein